MRHIVVCRLLQPQLVEAVAAPHQPHSIRREAPRVQLPRRHLQQHPAAVGPTKRKWVQVQERERQDAVKSCAAGTTTVPGACKAPGKDPQGLPPAWPAPCLA